MNNFIKERMLTACWNFYAGFVFGMGINVVLGSFGFTLKDIITVSEVFLKTGIVIIGSIVLLTFLVSINTEKFNN